MRILKDICNYKPGVPFELLVILFTFLYILIFIILFLLLLIINMCIIKKKKQIQLLQHDDRPINLTNNKITIMYGCRCYVDELLHTSEYTLDSDGKVLLTFNIPYDNIRIKVSIYFYKHCTRLLDLINSNASQKLFSKDTFTRFIFNFINYYIGKIFG